QRAAQRDQGRITAQVVDAQVLPDGIGAFVVRQLFDQGAYRRPAFVFVVGEKARLVVARKITLELLSRAVGQHAVRDHERKRLIEHACVRAVELGRIEKSGWHADEQW